MENLAIARIFDSIAELLELEGDENPFRIRAYRRASLSLQALSEDVAKLAEKKELRSIPGVGEDLAAKITEYLKTGRIDFYERLRKKTPSFLVEMLEIPGVGPKTARAVYDRFKPKNFTALKALAEAHKLRGLPGFKEKTEQNILQGIGIVEKGRERTLLGRALPLAREIIERLKKSGRIIQIDYAGSVRRMCETIGDIDILVSSASPKAVMDTFVKMKGTARVLAQGPTKSSLLTREGMQVDLRVVQKECFGAALLYFTGSKAHNVQLRTLAKKRGLKINEYGLFRLGSGKRVSATEEGIYKALGLNYIPPELREDQGEIEAARKGPLPRLVECADVKGELHMHSNWTDGVEEILTMAETAKKKGYEYAVLTDHSQSLTVAHGLKPKDLLKQVKLVRKLNEKLKGFTLLAGSEVDILSDGSLDYEDEILKQLDFVVASVHSRFKQDKAEMTRRIVKAMQNKYVRMIGHPTGRLMGERHGYDVDFDEIFRAAKKTNTAIEINSYPQRLDLSALNAKNARDAGVMLAVTTDAHTRHQFDNLEYGVGQARRAWCTRENILNCLSLPKFKQKVVK